MRKNEIINLRCEKNCTSLAPSFTEIFTCFEAVTANNILSPTQILILAKGDNSVQLVVAP